MLLVKDVTLLWLKVSNMDVKRVILIIICFVFVLSANAYVELYEIEDDGIVASLSIFDGEGLYVVSTSSLSLTYKDNANDIQFFMYMDG